MRGNANGAMELLRNQSQTLIEEGRKIIIKKRKLDTNDENRGSEIQKENIKYSKEWTKNIKSKNQERHMEQVTSSALDLAGVKYNKETYKRIRQLTGKRNRAKYLHLKDKSGRNLYTE